MWGCVWSSLLYYFRYFHFSGSIKTFRKVVVEIYCETGLKTGHDLAKPLRPRHKCTNVPVFAEVQSLGFEHWCSVSSVRVENSDLCVSPPQAGARVQSPVLCFWQISYCGLDLVDHVPVYTFHSLLLVSTLGQWLRQEFSSTDPFSHAWLSFRGLPAWNSRVWANVRCISIYAATSFPFYHYTWAGKVVDATQQSAKPH